jgi:hypothetical protein
MNRILKRLAAFVFVGLFATAIATSCGQKAAEQSGDTEAAKDTTDHPAGEHPASDTTEHPTDTTTKK